MKKVFLFTIFMMLTGCASVHSQYGAVPNALIYEHREPKEKVSQVVTDEKGIIKQVIPWGEISENAPAIGNSVANIVQAINGYFGFPFSIVPELVSGSLKGAKDLKEENQEQEVTKVYWVEGMKNISVTLPNNIKIEASTEDSKLPTSSSISPTAMKGEDQNGQTQK